MHQSSAPAKDQAWPNGSRSRPYQAPQSISRAGKVMVAPAFSARASTRSTEARSAKSTCWVTVVAPRAVGGVQALGVAGRVVGKLDDAAEHAQRRMGDAGAVGGGPALFLHGIEGGGVEVERRRGIGDDQVGPGRGERPGEGDLVHATRAAALRIRDPSEAVAGPPVLP